MRISLAVFLAAIVGTGVACGGDTSEQPAPPKAPDGKRVDDATAGAISGRVTFDGAVPPAQFIPMAADPKCVQEAGPNPQSDALLVAEDRGLRNAFVYIKDGLDPAYVFDPPAAPAVLDQKGCLYRPRVLGVRVGQTVEIVNSDPTLHNVHALPMLNQEFNHGQPKPLMRLSKVFTTPEVMVRFKCDVHAWMAAWVGVLPHPYFAVSDAAGTFQIPHLPPGTYTVEAWHEKLGTTTAEVTIGSSESQVVSLTFAGPVK